VTIYLDVIELAGGVPALHPERKGKLNLSPLKNWVEKNGGLPTYINSVATALLREHPEWGISRIIATAVNWAKKVCVSGMAFGGKVKVSKAVQAAACKAVAEWKAKKAKASDDTIDDAILELAKEDTLSLEYLNAGLRKDYRSRGIEIPEVICLSDEEYFTHVVEEPFQLSEVGEEVDIVDNIEAFMEVMELSAAAQSAVRLPLNEGAAQHISGNKYKKEILRLGEIVVDRMGRKFNFTGKFMKGLRDNFKKNPIDYVPLLYTKEGEVHASSGNPDLYGGVVEDLELDNETNPTKLYGVFNLTEKTAEVVEHNPKFGVSVTAHPNYVDTPRGVYYGPTLLDVAATHKPKLTKMDSWEKIAVKASDEITEYEILDLSDETFVETLTEEKEASMADEKTVEQQPINLSNEQIEALLESDAFKSVLNSKVEAATAEKDAEITRLSDTLGTMQKNTYKQGVETLMAAYKSSGVPPVITDAAEVLLMSFEGTDADETFQLSQGDETLELTRIKLVGKMLDEAKGLVNLSSEQGGEEDPEETVGLSDEEATSAVNQLVSMAKAV
jgi:hypothetical protein